MPSTQCDAPPAWGRSRAAKAALAAALLLLLQSCGAPPPPAAPPAPAAPAPLTRPSDVPTLQGRMLADAQEYPWSAIGRLNLAGRGFCNGIVIGPQQVLTQANCLYDARRGRWYPPQELHFIAAYQRDDYLADSEIAGFTVAPGYTPQAGASLANLTNNWALVTLEAPIGRKTGWLGLQWETTELQHAWQAGRAAYLRAGYRSDLPHAVNLHFGCNDADGVVRVCDPTPRELALPPFIVIGGELRVLAEFYLALPRQSDPLPRLTGHSLRDWRLGAGQPPSEGPVGRAPTATLERLLETLGYPVSGGDIASAAAAFHRDRGLPASGDADMRLLAELLNAAQRDIPAH